MAAGEANGWLSLGARLTFEGIRYHEQIASIEMAGNAEPGEAGEACGAPTAAQHARNLEASQGSGQRTDRLEARAERHVERRVGSVHHGEREDRRYGHAAVIEAQPGTHVKDAVVVP